jgi:phosphatidylglycerophosphate synthase
MNVWRDRFSRWFSPLALRCPLSPNAVTVLALVLNACGASLLYLGWREPRLFLVAVFVIAIGGLADAFDGIVARVQKKQSRFGDFLDHFCDRVSDLLLAAGWLLGNGVRADIAVSTLLAVMLNGYIGTQVEATYGQRDYETVGRGEFVLALIVYPIVSYVLFSNGWSRSGWLMTIPEWMSLLMAVFAILGIVQRLALARRLERS